jgi:hypothetical protein
MEMTKLYDLHLSYESGWDTEPRLYVYEVYETDEGWQAEHHFSYSYYFEQEDMEWLIQKFELESIFDYSVDEWFTTDDTGLAELNLPPTVIKWLEKLPEYEYEKVA